MSDCEPGQALAGTALSILRFSNPESLVHVDSDGSI